MKLGAQQTPLCVDRPGQLLIKFLPFSIIKRGTKAVSAHGNVPDDDHGAAPRGNGAQTLQPLLLGKPHGGGRKDHAVF